MRSEQEVRKLLAIVNTTGLEVAETKAIAVTLAWVLELTGLPSEVDGIMASIPDVRTILLVERDAPKEEVPDADRPV